MSDDVTRIDIDALLAEVDEILERYRVNESDCETIWRAVADFAEWRVREVASASDPEALKRALTDPRQWARVALDMPGMEELLARDFEPGTAGAWLQRALAEERAKRSSGNVVDIETRRKPSA